MIIYNKTLYYSLLSRSYYHISFKKQKGKDRREKNRVLTNILRYLLYKLIVLKVMFGLFFDLLGEKRICRNRDSRRMSYEPIKK